MITVLKLTLANIGHKKFRTSLLILSIVLSVALMYTVLSLTNQTTDIFRQKIKKEVGNAQLMLLPKENSGEQYIDEMNFNQQKGMEYEIPLITAYGYSEINEDKQPVIFTGMSSEDFRTIYGLNYVEKNSEDIKENQVLIGEEAADVYQLSLGDQLDVSMNNQTYSFIISGIIEDHNNSLGYELGSLELVVAKDTLTNILGLEDKVNGYYIRTDAQTSIKELKFELENAYPELQVKDVTDMSDYRQMLQMIVTSLFLMVSAVVIVSAFIIYSSFKIIAIE
ncbi:MAG TPA: ABC transporter permease, partial [Mobilitalea sp.]|nr:ABC transporter permease [Mobilitalea sp.]